MQLRNAWRQSGSESDGNDLVEAYSAVYDHRIENRLIT